MLKKVTRFHFKVLFVVCLLSVSYLALMPIAELPNISSYDKANHFIAFFVLSVLQSFCYTKSRNVNVMAWLFVYGMLLEVLQGTTTFRHFSYLDLLADVFGIVVGLILTTTLWPYLRPNKIN
ncbi:VanZ family protein [Thalassotalea psychrophila]|uniref:VanZ family protein n=1 Tax=Thalassotalea psychrophila TaxID=3065647 RepID=A0ABY9TR18_9GAMM|nr:VanZ family protein [Colwelliaceae bacterium SQ149]